MPQAELEPSIPAIERTQTYALESMSIGTGEFVHYLYMTK